MGIENMGYWGEGNFDGDDPRDFLADMVAVWERNIDHSLAGEWNEVMAYFGPDVQPRSYESQEAIDAIVMPTAEIMIAVAEKFKCDYLPSREKVSNWATQVLRVYDTVGVDEWGPGGERRDVYVATFGSLFKIVDDQAGRIAGLEEGADE
jgi:hypothetical protein